jgi:hypothetical protein
LKPTETVSRALPDPSVIIELAVAYRSSMILFTAVEVGVFTQLAEAPLTATDLAERTGTEPRPLEMLLNACVAYKLLNRNGRCYMNTRAADTFLVAGKKAFIGSGLKYSEDLYPAWGQLSTLVRTNRPIVPTEEYTGQDPEKTRNFVYGMHNRTLGISAALPYGVDLTGRKRLLDVGGGPGTYSIILVRATEGLHSTVMDLPGVIEISREIIESYKLTDRIDTLPGSYLTDEFKSGNDVVLLSGMMHRETAETCQHLLGKAFGSLEDGGIVVVSDVFFDDESHDQPVFATHFALNMMLTSDDGSAHGKTEMAAWMKEAGFAEVEVKDLPQPNPHSLVIGIKP